MTVLESGIIEEIAEEVRTSLGGEVASQGSVERTGKRGWSSCAGWGCLDARNSIASRSRARPLHRCTRETGRFGRWGRQWHGCGIKRIAIVLPLLKTWAAWRILLINCYHASFSKPSDQGRLVNSIWHSGLGRGGCQDCSRDKKNWQGNRWVKRESASSTRPGSLRMRKSDCKLVSAHGGDLLVLVFPFQTG